MHFKIDKEYFYRAFMALAFVGLVSFFIPDFAEDAKINIDEPGSLLEHSAFPIGGQSRPDNKDKDDDDGSENGKGEARLELEGVLMWDFDHFSGAHRENNKDDYHKGSESEIRRACIDLKGKFKKNWEAKLEVSFNESDSSTEIENAYIEFTGWDYAVVTIGQAKEPFGLEELTSSQDITTIERSMVTCAFAPGRQPGLGLSGDTKKLTWAIGVYESLDREKKRDTYALTGRLTFAPWEHIHLGLAGSVRDYGGEKYEIEEHAEVHTARQIVTSGKTPARKVNLLGFEAAWVAGPFSVQAEHISAFIKADTLDDATYEGYYLQVSYFLTGESRPYKKGAFDSINPKAKYGALELLSRYSVLDAKANDKGVRAANLTLGVNYYVNKKVRLMGNYITTDLKGDKLTEDSANAVSFRMQYSF